MMKEASVENKPAPVKKSFIDRIVPEAHTIGLFHFALKSRQRLFFSAGVALFIQCAILWGGGWVVEHFSSSPLTNIFVIAIICISLLASGYIVALCIGDLLFPGPWREKMYHGASYVPESFEEQAALLKNKGFYFILLCLVSIFLVTIVCDTITGGFLTRYRKTGSVLALMKSDLERDRISGLNVFSNPLSMKRWKVPELRDQVRVLLTDQNNEVIAKAAYVAGRIELAEAASELMENLNHEDANVRSETALALGRIDWKRARTQLLMNLEKAILNGSNPEVQNILYALTLLNDNAAITPVIKFLELCLVNTSCNDDNLAYAFYFLKKVQATGASKLCFSYLTSVSVSENAKCYAADTLRYIAKPRDVEALKNAFERANTHHECKELHKKIHEEFPILLIDEEPLRAKLLRAVGNQKDMANYDWIWRVGANENEHPLTRKAAEIYTRAMLELTRKQ